jgi:diketogulonate reductase-like aldo/keto reductase
VHDNPVLKDLGNGVQMPVLGLGVWQMDEGAETENAVEWALEAGYRHIDTAQLYRNERSVGAAIRRSGIPRDEIFVTTKWLPTVRSPGRELERSLERLGMEYVDLYLIHWPVPLRAGPRGWRDLEELADRGLAREIGVSNYGDDRLEKTVARARRKPVVNQVQFSPFAYRRALLDRCNSLGVVLESYSPLEQGRVVDDPTVGAIARRIERTSAQVLLRWGVQRGTVVIPKSSRRERIVENAGIFDFELGEDDMRTLDALDRTGGTGHA